MNSKNALVQLSKLALGGRRQDIQQYIRRLTKNEEFSDIHEELLKLLENLPTQASPFKSKSFGSIPVDLDSRLQLTRFEQSPIVDHPPIWQSNVEESLRQIIDERNQSKSLAQKGLTPSKTALFTGKPGVGKTLAARWLANQLGLPLLILDLSAVMSSFLGRTGVNLRMVIDYAKSIECVFLIDEIDAVAKRRDDHAEIGELKRLVTVLLQEIDDWPSDNLLLAATNHPGLLDPALWRRFETIIDFPLPDNLAREAAFTELMKDETAQLDDLFEVLVARTEGKSFSDIEKISMKLRRQAVLDQKPIKTITEDYIKSSLLQEVDIHERKRLAKQLLKNGRSQRRINELLGISRDTIRKMA